MDLKEYFDGKKGTGILATANSDGKVTMAVYSMPHFLEDGTIAFVMRERLTHENLQSNPHAAYMFIEEGHGYRGIRLYLKKVREEKDSPLTEELKRRWLTDEEDKEKGPKYLVVFSIEKTLPLIGSGEEG